MSKPSESGNSFNSQKKTFEQTLPLKPIQSELVIEVVTNTLRNEVEKTGITDVILGLSGGIDSALTLHIAAQAFDKKKIHAFYLPYTTSSPQSYEHAKLAAKNTGVTLQTIDISNMADAYFEQEINSSSNSTDADIKMQKLRKGNVMARLRMIALYDQSAKINALVLGTSNKTEILLGYSTLWGDMASAVNPLGDLYKYQVRELSRALQVPNAIIDKPPSADLWEDQTDEDELGITYDMADRILFHWIDLAWPKSRLLESLAHIDTAAEKVEMILKKVQYSQYKRKMPLIIKLSETTIDREFRYPRDWGL